MTQEGNIVINSSTNILRYFMELLKGGVIKREGYENMYYIQSLSLQHNRYLCHNTYLSNPKNTYYSSRPLI